MAATLITAPLNYNLTRNPIYVTLESDKFSGASAPFSPTEENLSARLEVWRSLTGDFATEEMLARLRAPYSSTDKQVTFDISRLVPSSFPLPVSAAIGVSAGTPYYGEATNLVNKIRLKYADQYGDPVTPEALTVSVAYHTVYGGLPADAVQSINWLGGGIGLHSYYYRRNTSYQFRKPVSKNQPDFIYFVSLVDDTVTVTVAIHYTDGTTDFFDSHSIACTANTAYWTQSGYNQLKVDDNADVDKTVSGYSVNMVRATGPQNFFSVFYVLDDECPSDERYLLYTNGFGGLETVRMKGNTNYAYRVNRETFKRTRWADFSIQVGDVDQIRTDGGTVFTTHTGHYPAYYVDHLKQLFHAKLWFIDLQELRFKRLISETDSAEIRSDQPAPYGFALTYRNAWLDDSHNMY